MSQCTREISQADGLGRYDRKGSPETSLFLFVFLPRVDFVNAILPLTYIVPCVFQKMR